MPDPKEAKTDAAKEAAVDSTTPAAEQEVTPADADKRFTQADLDRIVTDRLSRAEKKWESTLKQRLDDERKQAEMTEAEKLRAAVTAAEDRAKSALAAADLRLIQAEVKLQSAELGVIDPDAAYALMAREGVEVDDKGVVQGVKGALAELLKAKPYLKKDASPAIGAGTKPGAQSGEANPWKNETYNLTRQAILLRDNPALAARFKAEAGIK